MKTRACVFFISSMILLLVGIHSVQATNGQVFIIPIKGEVGPAMEKFVHQSIREAEENHAKAIVFQIDTPGGVVENAINISEEILNTPIKTIAYIKNEAISAGTLIAISAQQIYMSSSATIGAAETRPNEEKYISYWTGKLRNVAQIRGRDPQLVAAMADADIQIKGVIQKGKLLTLTSKEALELNFIEGIENSVEEVKKSCDLENYSSKQLEPSFQLKLAALATSTMVTSILLTIGFIGIIVEIFTPGFGVGGAISIVCFGLYFGGVLLAGYSSWVAVFLFIIGFILLLIEVFAPGFGIPGIGGILSIIISIIMASSSIEQAILSLCISLLLTIIAGILLIKFVPKNKFFSRITLSTSLNTENGYISSDIFKDYIGKIGITLTPLRPSGSIEVDGIKLDVVSDNRYIGKNQKVKIIKIEGNRIIVQKLN
ncbi:NfeD family protein [Garciella nitratireducens]|uniref:NfeD family protein n=1 Tax=Garciella nitratireducens TaxID=218205 RepID=UPI000DE93305|nr:NfeD family protein [Garciella nitratireducens]RBP45495.1 membrane-bound serine protease (ClpP class) [Garciella nitratireducens]